MLLPGLFGNLTQGKLKDVKILSLLGKNNKNEQNVFF